MRAVRCIGGRATIADVPLPQGDGLRVRVVSAGICGSDLHLEPWDLPITMGHEVAGLLPDGTPIAIEPMAPCGWCDQCRTGSYNHCRSGASVLLGVGIDGGMAEEVLVPPSALVPLAKGVSVRDACLVEPLAVAVHAVRRGRLQAGDRVAVVGGGTIGQTAICAALDFGSRVDAEVRHDHQREAADILGAGQATDHYDVVLEAAGTESALLRSIELCRPGGRVVLLGTYWDDVMMPGMAMALAEIDLVPASMYSTSESTRDIDVAARILADHPLIPKTIITHRFPLDGVVEAFATARDRSAGAIKVVLEP